MASKKVPFKEFYDFYKNYKEIDYLFEEQELISNLFKFVADYFGYLSNEMIEFNKFSLYLRRIKNECIFGNCDEIIFDEKLFNKKLNEIEINVKFNFDKTYEMVLFCVNYFKKMFDFIEKNTYDILLKLLNFKTEIYIDKKNNNFAFIDNSEKGVMHIFKIDNEWWYRLYVFDIYSFKIVKRNNGILDKNSPYFRKILPDEIRDIIFDVEELV